MAGPNHDHRIHIDHNGPPRSQLPVHLLLLLAQFLAGVGYVLTSVVLVGGMNRIVLSLYRDIVAMAILIPAAYFVDKGNRVILSWDVILHLLVLGVLGIYGSNYLIFMGIEYTSPELSAAAQPLIPALTALIAIVSGIEVVHWFRRDGQAKVLGIVSSCAGAVVMTMYKGPAVLQLWNDVVHGLTSFVTSQPEDMGYADMGSLQLQGWMNRWRFGGLCLIGSCVCMASFMNLQAPLLKRFPAPVSILAYAYGFGAICMAITGYFAVPDTSEWALGFNVDLGVVLWNGVIASAVIFGINGWCLNRVGPLFVASYIPLQTVITGILSLFFLGSIIYLGSIIGAVFVLTGLLLVSWSREETFRLASLSRRIDGNQAEDDRETVKALREPLIQVHD
ncbi:unnamed protein product [Calypogeia fissa]